MKQRTMGAVLPTLKPEAIEQFEHDLELSVQEEMLIQAYRRLPGDFRETHLAYFLSLAERLAPRRGARVEAEKEVRAQGTWRHRVIGSC